MFLSVVFPLSSSFGGSAAWRRLDWGLRGLRRQLPYPIEAIAVVAPGDADRAGAARRAGLIVVEAEASGVGALASAGLLGATGDFRALLDPAWPLDPEQILMLLPPAQSGIDLALASRQVPGATLAGVGWLERLALRLTARLFSALLFAGLTDAHSGVVVIRDEAAHAILSRATERGLGLDTEVAVLARELGFTMSEVPVDWTGPRDGGPLAALRQRLAAILRVRRRLRAGAYPPLPPADPEETDPAPLMV